MSSNLLDRFGSAFSFRLNLWYASIFTVSACGLYFFLYLLLSVAIETKDKKILLKVWTGGNGNGISGSHYLVVDENKAG